MLDHSTVCQIVGDLYIQSVLKVKEAVAASQKTLSGLQETLRQKESQLADSYKQNEQLQARLRKQSEPTSPPQG